MGSPQGGLLDAFVQLVKPALGQLALLFLRLGCTAVGGPAAHIAMMKSEVVDRHHWIDEQEFLDLLGACNLIPGPNSTELAIHIGHRLAGGRGLLLVGICFILPAVLITALCAELYRRGGTLPQATALLAGVKPVILGVLVWAVASLTQTALKTPRLTLVAVVTAGTAFVLDELTALLGISVVYALTLAPASWRQRRVLCLLAGLPLTLSLAGGRLLASQGSHAYDPWLLGGFFLKVGSLLYGSGYVLITLLDGTLVQAWGWLTRAQLLDAVAVGQFTPGPVFSTATFVGYLLDEGRGATVATLAIFIPSFVLVAVSARWLRQLRLIAIARAFLDGVNAASIGLMTAAVLRLATHAVPNIPSAVLTLLSLVGLTRGLNSAWLLLAGALVGSLGWL